METGELDPEAAFMLNSSRHGPLYSQPYGDEPEVIEQFRPGERQVRFEAEWTED